MASVRDDTGPPLGAWRRISSSSSAIAFSATGFLLMFLIRPISRDMPRCLSVGSSCKAINPGAGSTLMMAGRPSEECNSLHKRPRASLKCGTFLVLDNGRDCIRGCGVAKNNDVLTTPFKYIGRK